MTAAALIVVDGQEHYEAIVDLSDGLLIVFSDSSVCRQIEPTLPAEGITFIEPLPQSDFVCGTTGQIGALQ